MFYENNEWWWCCDGPHKPFHIHTKGAKSDHSLDWNFSFTLFAVFPVCFVCNGYQQHTTVKRIVSINNATTKNGSRKKMKCTSSNIDNRFKKTWTRKKNKTKNQIHLHHRSIQLIFVAQIIIQRLIQNQSVFKFIIEVFHFNPFEQKKVCL